MPGDVYVTALFSGSSYEVSSSQNRLHTQLAAGVQVPNLQQLVPSERLGGSGVDDDSAPTMSTTSMRRIGNKMYRLSVESTLYLSRPYRIISNTSELLIDTLRRPRPRWSLYTRESNFSVFSLPVSIHSSSGTSLAETVDLPTLPLAAEVNDLPNPVWYDHHAV